MVAVTTVLSDHVRLCDLPNSGLRRRKPRGRHITDVLRHVDRKNAAFAPKIAGGRRIHPAHQTRRGRRVPWALTKPFRAHGSTSRHFAADCAMRPSELRIRRSPPFNGDPTRRVAAYCAGLREVMHQVPRCAAIPKPVRDPNSAVPIPCMKFINRDARAGLRGTRHKSALFR